MEHVDDRLIFSATDHLLRRVTTADPCLRAYPDREPDGPRKALIAAQTDIRPEFAQPQEILSLLLQSQQSQEKA